MLLVLASLLCQAEPVARWTFDGDVKDSGPARAAHQSRRGRLEFIDSPVSGKAAVFNGVDAFVQVDPPGKLGVGSDFSLSAWVLVPRPAAGDDLRPQGLVAPSDGRR